MTNECMICREVWTSNGLHRVVSLKCGHIFGRNCIYEWLTKNSSCPFCTLPANKDDVRILYLESEAIKLHQESEIKRLKQKTKKKIEKIYDSVKKERKESASFKEVFKKIQKKLQECVKENTLLMKEDIKKLLDFQFEQFELSGILEEKLITSYDFFNFNQKFEFLLLIDGKLCLFTLTDGLKEVETLKDQKFEFVRFNSKRKEILLVGKKIFYILDLKYNILQEIVLEYPCTSISLNENVYVICTNIGQFIIIDRRKETHQHFSLNDKSPIVSSCISDNDEVFLSQGVQGLYYFSLKRLEIEKKSDEYTLSVSYDKYSNQYLYSTLKFELTYNIISHYLIKSDHSIQFLFSENSEQLLTQEEKIGINNGKLLFQTYLFSSLDFGNFINLEDESVHSILNSYLVSYRDQNIYIYELTTNSLIQRLKLIKNVSEFHSYSTNVGFYFSFKNQEGIFLYVQKL